MVSLRYRNHCCHQYNGIATVGLSLEDATTDTDFTGSLTFSNEVRFTGLTLDVSGATLFGNVRSVNGLTGAVTIGLESNDPSAIGDIIIKRFLHL